VVERKLYQIPVVRPKGGHRVSVNPWISISATNTRWFASLNNRGFRSGTK